MMLADQTTAAYHDHPRRQQHAGRQASSALQVARFSRKRTQLLKPGVDLSANDVDEVRHGHNTIAWGPEIAAAMVRALNCARFRPEGPAPARWDVTARACNRAGAPAVVTGVPVDSPRAEPRDLYYVSS